MLHLGDITKIKGNEAPVVDCVTFGAPCQDLSVAGKRKGMLHESRGDEETSRSGLFHEAIRIIKEMRENDRLSKLHRGTDESIRPRYAVYENVPGAFSSNKGEDFRVVLEEVARIVEEGVSIPRPEKGKWSNSGVIIGDGWSIAWRVFDAQYWGVPQRRKRICLVAILMAIQQPKSYLTRLNNTDAPTEEIPSHLSEILEQNPDPKYNLSAKACQGILNRAQRRGKKLPPMLQEALEQVILLSHTKTEKDVPGGGKGFLLQEDRSASLRTNNFQTVFQPVVYNGVQVTSPQNPQTCKELFDMWKKGEGIWILRQALSEIQKMGKSIHCEQRKIRYIVRRLTPLECTRLQGYPDGWVDIDTFVDSKGKTRKVSDSHKYKALGNSIALPSWRWVLKRMCANYERPATMASLFDGISGFPWLWTQINGRNSVLWTSEIEDFPSEVCKRHFGNEAKGEIGDYETFL